MAILKWIIILLATLNFGFMCYDGSRALIVGDYVRPESGEYVGQLGPWHHVAEAVSIDPESNLMKSIFLIWGGLGLIVTVSFAMNVRNAGRALVIMNVASLWYLVVGTASSVIQLILYGIYSRRVASND